MSKAYPQELIKAFKKCKESKWAEETYPEFAEQAKKYLKGKAEDKLEHSKLVVELARLYIETKGKDTDEDSGEQITS